MFSTMSASFWYGNIYFSSLILTFLQLFSVSTALYPLVLASLTILLISLKSTVETWLCLSNPRGVNGLMYILSLFSLGILLVNSSFSVCIPSTIRRSLFFKDTGGCLYSFSPVRKLYVGRVVSSPFNKASSFSLNKSISIASGMSYSYSPFSFLGVSFLSLKKSSVDKVNGFSPLLFKYKASFLQVVVLPEEDGPAIRTIFISFMLFCILFAISSKSLFCFISFSSINSFILPFITTLFTSLTYFTPSFSAHTA